MRQSAAALHARSAGAYEGQFRRVFPTSAVQKLIPARSTKVTFAGSAGLEVVAYCLTVLLDRRKSRRGTPVRCPCDSELSRTVVILQHASNPVGRFAVSQSTPRATSAPDKTLLADLRRTDTGFQHRSRRVTRFRKFTKDLVKAVSMKGRVT